MTEYD